MNRRIESTTKKVYVGMSGGVDSSVSALLLKLTGYEVTGVFIKVWQPESDNLKLECTWKDERRDAMRVAATLNIPFLTLDFSERYKKEVVDYMITEYKHGRTPNPDVMCNRQIKFGSFLDESLRQGADYIATGHYAQNIQEGDEFKLVEGKDKNKDQSYFLWTLQQKDLQHTLFPIGHLEKPEVRAIAEKYNLPVFDKKDSQGICFLGQVDMKEFLKEYISTEKGNVLDSDGKIIGEHDGALLYTIGERHGFKLNINQTNDAANYIISKDIKANTLTVVSHDVFLKGEHMKQVAIIQACSWTDKEPVEDKIYEARLRYRQEKQPCTVKKVSSKYSQGPFFSDSFEIFFNKIQTSITPGQSLVLYDGSDCVGGGIIN